MGRGLVPEEGGGCFNLIAAVIGTLLLTLFVNLTIDQSESSCEMFGELFEIETETRWVMLCQFQKDGVWVDLTLENLRGD